MDKDIFIKLLAQREFKAVRSILDVMNEVDIASLLSTLSDKELALAFRLIPKDKAAEVFSNMDTSMQTYLVTMFTEKELKELLDDLYMDDTVDMLEELPANLVKRILATVSASDRSMINQLLNYPEDSAGSIMTTEYVDLREEMTVGQAMAHIKKTGIHKETIYTCYITERRKLVGIVSAKDLMTTDDDVPIKDLMETEIISVYTHADQEQVAQLFTKYDLLALPVIDQDGRMVGIVTCDDAMDVMVDEATEDITKMAAINPSEKTYFETSVLQHAKNRIPWLLILMFTSIITGTIITRYENAFAAIPLLVSFIPMLIGSGCGVPGVMASRTIENDRDRKMTIMTTTFIPCGAKLPIIAMIAGAFFNNSGWVATSAYFVGIAAIICSGIILKKTKMFAGDPAPFVMELPAYHWPTVSNVLRSMWERGWSFIKKAGTIILLSTIVLWFLMSFGWESGSFGMVEELNNSILASIGSAIAWIFAPLGWTKAGNGWKMAVAAVSGLIAKENVVATFGQLFGFAEVAEDGSEIWKSLSLVMTPVAAYGFLVFNLLCAPCFAAMGAIKREMNNGKWTAIAIGYMCLVAYCASLVVYQIGGLITGEVGFNIFTIVAVAIIVFTIYMLVRPNKYLNDNEVKIDVKKVAASK